MHGLAVTSRDSWLVGALLGLDDFREYRVARDADLCALILEKEKAFWTNNVLKGVPPVELVRDDAIKLFKRDTGEVVKATAELAEAVHRIKKLREVAKVHAEEEERLLNLIKAEMKDAAVLEYDGQPLCSWKTQTAKRFNQTKFKQLQPELFAQYVHASESRVFRIR